MAPHQWAASLGTLDGDARIEKWMDFDLRLGATPCAEPSLESFPEGTETVTIAAIRDEKPMFAATFAMIGADAMPLVICDFAPTGEAISRTTFGCAMHPTAGMLVPSEIVADRYDAEGAQLSRRWMAAMAWSAEPIDEEMLSPDLPRMLADLDTAQHATGVPVIVNGPGEESQVKYLLGEELIDANTRRARMQAAAAPDTSIAQP